MKIIEQLEAKKHLILDGAMGTELYRRGVGTALPLWSAIAILEKPDVVRQIHEDYINAGADIITTNTFRTDFRTFHKAGFSKRAAEEATSKAVDLARKAISSASVNRKIWITGSMSPLEDCYRPDLAPDYPGAYREHKIKARWLAQAGVDFILIETMNSTTEALAAVRAALETDLPVAVSFILIDKDHILNGAAIFDIYRTLKAEGVDLFSINCTHSKIISAFLDKYLDCIELPVICYANAGIYHPLRGWEIDEQLNPDFYAEIAQKWFSLGVKVVGGCCGIGPEYIQRIAEKESPV